MADNLKSDWFNEPLTGMPARSLLFATGTVTPEEMGKPSSAWSRVSQT